MDDDDPTLSSFDRFVGEDWPWSQDPIAYALAMPCALDVDDVYGYGPPLDKAEVGRQLNALKLDHCTATPGAKPQRIVWLEDAHQFNIGRVLLTGTTWEVARLAAPTAAIGVVERIATYLRVQPLNSAGAPQGPAYEFAMTPHGIPAFGANPAIGGYIPVPSPFPFPFPHPDVAVAPLQVRFHLRFEVLSDTNPSTSAYLANVSQLQLPPEPVISDWVDNRYAWGMPYTHQRKHVFQGHSRCRLFVTVFATTNRWSVRVGGLLGGFSQSAGPDGEAVRTATSRVG